MTLECKCHGVSGSCSVRTCWLAMADFRRTGDHLRKRYNGAVQVAVNQYGTGFTAAHTHFKRPSKNDLVYFEDSPDYCVRDHESGKHPPAFTVPRDLMRQSLCYINQIAVLTLDTFNFP